MIKSDPYCINLWAGPGIGKSRTAAGLFNLMKHRGHRVELVTERAKFFTYERNVVALKDQFYLMCLQEYSQRIVRDHVDYIITDSPPMMGMAYADMKDLPILYQMGDHFRSRYGNLDVLLLRDEARAYESYGRNETELEAHEKHQTVKGIYRSALANHSVDHCEVLADDAAAHDIYHKMVVQNG